MDAVELYCAVEKIRVFTFSFNLQYKRQNVELEMDRLLPYIQEVYRIGMLDELYWKNTNVDFHELIRQKEELKSAIFSEDYVYVYDKLNYELWSSIKAILKVLLKKNYSDLSNFFWNWNRDALKIRYPEILMQMEMISEEKRYKYIRDYGLRGRVVYNIDADREYDLYSAYNPSEIASRIVETSYFEKCNKIYMWGYSGGFEVDGIMNAVEFKNKDLGIEIYVTDLNKFRQILNNTKRREALLHSHIDWRFNLNVRNFISDFSLNLKEESYIYLCDYVSEYNYKEMKLLKNFIQKYAINSNIVNL